MPVQWQHTVAMYSNIKIKNKKQKEKHVSIDTGGQKLSHRWRGVHVNSCEYGKFRLFCFQVNMNACWHSIRILQNGYVD